MSGPSLGCTLLMRNELIHLERLVPKLLEVFDQIVFVTHAEPNTDGSDEFLASHGIEPIRAEWVEDFSVARMRGLDAMTTDYTMWLDCDDDLVTERPDLATARREVKSFLAGASLDSYLHPVFWKAGGDHWLRRNWFRNGAEVTVRYPVHELFLVPGKPGRFPIGLLDRVNSPLRANYPGKHERYYRMALRYVNEVDATDCRMRFQAARECPGPADDSVSLWTGFLTAVSQDGSYRHYAEEWLAVYTLLRLAERGAIDAVGPDYLRAVAEVLVGRYSRQFTAHVVRQMIEWRLGGGAEAAMRLHEVVADRDSYEICRSPWHVGWHYARALNICGWTLYSESKRTRSVEMARLAVEMLGAALNDRPPHLPTIRLAFNNRARALAWLADLGG